MSQFPILRTGAVAQYPAQRATRYSTQVSRFLDGTEQRWRSAPLLRRWVIRLDLLDEGELAGLETFFSDVQGQETAFPFTDPWDGTVYPNCTLADADFRLVLEGPGRGRTQLVIQENRT